ncbi:phosphate regulon sensor histidine kinase PhoR [Aestuariispira ectoiniformans]|uniref:phosphate regulon sensor histidine kinase PhoR n=1 Tax=Aestuariispira ectoiniformans TaxID=2775080 RepID=UPI00223B1BC5|nr:phosphate regulon sensor histidine kinase PhoR [Aestuariispira ectoiniformans]
MVKAGVIRWTALAAAPYVGLAALLVYLGHLPVWPVVLLTIVIVVSIAMLVRNRIDAEVSLQRQFQRLKEHTSISNNDDVRRAAIIESMIDSLPDPLIFISHDQRIMRVNTAATALGAAAEPGRRLTDLFRQPKLLSAVEKAIVTEQAQMAEISLPAPVEQTFLVRLLPIHHAPGIPERKNASALLMAMQDVTQAHRSERMRADFVANVSHELRTPLTSLIGFIETLLGPAKDDIDAHEQFLKIMQEQSGRMLRIIEDLLSLSRIELDEHTRPSQQVEIRDVLGKVHNVLAMKAAKREMELQFDIPESLPPVAGDSDQLIQVFQNLIDNAIKYGREGTPVEVSAKPTGSNRIDISIRDHGAGIPRDHLPRLTERFYRVDAARSREIGGTGLGLAIVKHIVNRHRGRLAVDSEQDKGTCFTVSLPIS